MEEAKNNKKTTQNTKACYIYKIAVFLDQLSLFYNIII